MQGAPAKAEEAKNSVKEAAEEVTKQESIVKAVALKLSELKGTVKEGSPTPTVPPNVESMSVEDLKTQLTAWGVEADWDPTQDKAVLIERVTVCVLPWFGSSYTRNQAIQSLYTVTTDTPMPKGPLNVDSMSVDAD
jgi:hypothetical protein